MDMCSWSNHKTTNLCVCVCARVNIGVWLKTAHASIWKSPGEKSPFCCHSSLCLSGVSCFEWGGGGKEGWGEGDQGLWREGRVQSRAGVVGMKSASSQFCPKLGITKSRNNRKETAVFLGRGALLWGYNTALRVVINDGEWRKWSWLDLQKLHLGISIKVPTGNI